MKKKLTPQEKLVAGTAGLLLFPFILTSEVYKKSQKKKYKKRKKKSTFLG